MPDDDTTTDLRAQTDLGTVSTLAHKGITPDFLNGLRGRIRSEVVRRAADYFRPGASPDSAERPRLKPEEKWVNFYDYQPCSVSVLGSLAAEGNEWALAVIHRIFQNARHCLGPDAGEPLCPIPLRRSPLHLAICYERICDIAPPDTARDWRTTIQRSGEWLLNHYDNLEERGPLDNRAFGTGINHIALVAESLWKAGEVVSRPEWRVIAENFIDRLVAYGHPDGYFEENTNDTREGGPSLAYTPLTAGCAYTVRRGGSASVRGFFERCGALYRNLHDNRLRPLALADERANPVDHRAHRPFGRALQSITPEGRGFLRLTLDPEQGHVNYGEMSLEHLARLDFELDQMECGPGAVPESLQEGAFRLRLPLGVLRRNGWTCGISTLKALNREICPNSDYALDRQSLVQLSHQEAGVILPGLKSKRDPLWSTVRIGLDAYPVDTGTLSVADDGMSAEAHYEGFAVQLAWTVRPNPVLTLASPADRELTVQLPLAMSEGQVIRLDSGRNVRLSEAGVEAADVTTISANAWTMEADRPGSLVWPIRPFDPYTQDNAGEDRPACCLFSARWQGRIQFRFHD